MKHPRRPLYLMKFSDGGEQKVSAPPKKGPIYCNMAKANRGIDTAYRLDRVKDGVFYMSLVDS